MNLLLSVAFAVLAGLMMTRVVKKLGLPDVTAYLVAGVLIGPYALGRLNLPVGFHTLEAVEGLNLMSDVALGFIAFAIGNEFRLSALKKTGKQATIVGIVQGLVAALFVDAALIGLHFILGDKLPISSAITLGAIATATAPAATLMVVRQYKAKGKLTDILLPVVALDDAVGLVVFAVSFGVARALGSGAIDLVSVLVNPALEIALSLVLGAVMGEILTQMEKLFNSNSNRLSMTIVFVLLTVAISKAEFHIGRVTIGFSSLLVCMMLGTIFCNRCILSGDLMEKADAWTAPLYVLFFVISGAELELDVFADLSVVGIGLVYILFRSLGKYVGAYGSCKTTGCDEKVTKYLGVTLLPQAGVALGMCLMVGELGSYEGRLIRNIVLFSVLVYELIGPTLTKWALTKAGDIQPKSHEVVNRRQMKTIKAIEEREVHKNS
ncbi:MAG: cation:proton antiporter [Eubacteriales bacterium]|nr:cation:proton antiporter [Clostridiales bacterium]MDY2770093.1 cation:proton antiporter [Eubacteriales bacterium]